MLKKNKRQEKHLPGDEPPAKRQRTCEPEPKQPAAGPSRFPGCYIGPNETPPLASAGFMQDGLYIEKFPIGTAGAPISSRRQMKRLRRYLKLCGPLGDPELFETAEILMTTGLTGRGRTKHLQSLLYRKGKVPWRNNRALLKDIDRLPKGPKWRTAEVSIGDENNPRTYTIYLRDILEVIRDLLGATRFRDCMRYAPERHWTSDRQKERVYDEMWSGNWWWRMQYQIRDPNGTVVPLIIATDETTLTNNPQGPKGYPVYMSIGNISKSTRRRPTKHAMVVIGYLPTDKFEDVAPETRQHYRGELLHKSLSILFRPLEGVHSHGMEAWCADGALRRVYPRISAWVADWPEQNDVACTVRNGCPRCMQKWQGRGRGNTLPALRDRHSAVEALRAYQHTGNDSDLVRLGLKPWPAFWENIPGLDIGMCLTPDLLHQLYKGMFEHAKAWVEDVLGTKEFNRRFKDMPRAQGLRYFKRGVTSVKVWSGRESREMMRQFLPVVIDTQAPSDFIQAMRALLDFSFLAETEQLTDAELGDMDDALELFHRTKKALVEMGVVLEEKSFDRLPKLHMLSHYTQSIRELGTPDGYSTETPEHLHIVYVKNGWRKSNRRNPMPQIVDYVKRLEAIQMQRALINEYYEEQETESRKEANGLENDDAWSDVSEGNEESGDEFETDGGVVRIEPDKQVAQVLDCYEAYCYPQPTISLAREPTISAIFGSDLITSYGASDLIRALRRFLLPKARLRGSDLILLPSDKFSVWHKATLVHPPLVFSPNRCYRQTTIRARPATRDSRSRMQEPGVFDTALFAAHADTSGLPRFRAGCIRAIFSLPPHLRHLYSLPLVYLDIFTAFESDGISPHGLYTTTAAHSHGRRASLVLPLSSLVLSCHLAPDFSLQPASLDTPALGKRLVFNEYYNHHTYRLVAHWRRLDTSPSFDGSLMWT